MQSDNFADWLDRTLAEQGISGSDVAKALGKSNAMISRWRNGKSKPNLEMVRRLATYLEVDPLRLIVTAGLMTPDEAGVSPLPVPEDTKTRELVLEQIRGIRYLTKEDKQVLIDAYDRNNRRGSK